MKRFVSVVGARPQFIKAALLSKELRKNSEEILVHTGQHYDLELSDLHFKALGIPEPDYNLKVGSGTHARQTGDMLVRLEKVIVGEKPDMVITYGDTNSTLAGALAAVKLGVKLAHVEAGLRSYNRSMPEEVNRLLTDHVSDLLLCPTRTAVLNLEREGIDKGVHFAGDIMYDLALASRPLAEKRKAHERFGLSPGRYILVTMHRPANTDDRTNLGSIVKALLDCGEPAILPLHPRTSGFLKRFGLYKRLGRGIVLTKPLDYLDFLSLLLGAKKVVTDSGGVQKEAFFHGKPCITLRDETEWPETVEDGWNVLVGADRKRIVGAIGTFEPRGRRGNHFGDGSAAKKICRILER